MVAPVVIAKLAPAVVLAVIFVFGLAEVLDGAIVAAVASVVNTWLIVRNDGRVRALRQEVRELKRRSSQRRRHTRLSDRDVVVIAPEDIADVAEWAGRDAA